MKKSWMMVLAVGFLLLIGCSKQVPTAPVEQPVIDLNKSNPIIWPEEMKAEIEAQQATMNLNYTIRVTLPDTFAWPGDKIDIPVIIDGCGPGVYSWQWWITWEDGEFLWVDSVYLGDICYGWMFAYNNLIPGEVRIAAASAYQLGGDGAVCWLACEVPHYCPPTTIMFDFLEPYSKFNEGNPQADFSPGVLVVQEGIGIERMDQ